jgi:hypothetical protein
MQSPLISTGLRGIVERILIRDVRPHDLNTLFFSMRQESGGRRVVGEIAHFIAHPEPRTQGISRDELRDFFMFAKFRGPLSSGKIIRTEIPGALPEALRANLRRVRARTLKRETALSPEQAGQMLERVLGRLVPTGHGTFKPGFAIQTRQEQAVISCLGKGYAWTGYLGCLKNHKLPLGASQS